MEARCLLCAFGMRKRQVPSSGSASDKLAAKGENLFDMSKDLCRLEEENIKRYVNQLASYFLGLNVQLLQYKHSTKIDTARPFCAVSIFFRYNSDSALRHNLITVCNWRRI